MCICYLLPWIVLDFYFAHGDSECLTQEITQFDIPFDLQTWLHVQAITMLIYTLALIPALIVSCCCPAAPCGVALGACGMCYMFLFGLFNLAWQIVGALMFWGDLYQTDGTCNSDLTVYMWVNLILGFVSLSRTNFDGTAVLDNNKCFLLEPMTRRACYYMLDSTGTLRNGAWCHLGSEQHLQPAVNRQPGYRWGDSWGITSTCAML